MYAYDATPFNLRRGGSSDTGYSMDETRGHQATRNKSVTERQGFYDFPYEVPTVKLLGRGYKGGWGVGRRGEWGVGASWIRNLGLGW